jgi:plasmid stabilization system protein ParE
MSRARPLRLVWSPAARRDLIRLRAFIEVHNPDAARRAAQALNKAAGLLCDQPDIGRRMEGRQDRELAVPFGQRGYLIRYRLHDDVIVVLRIWHGLENRS